MSPLPLAILNADRPLDIFTPAAAILNTDRSHYSSINATDGNKGDENSGINNNNTSGDTQSLLQTSETTISFRLGEFFE